MINSQTTKGICLVMAGATSCAVVGVIMKLAASKGFQTSEIIFTQTLLGALFMTILFLVARNRSKTKGEFIVTKKDKYKLMLGGIPLALTNTFYYLSIQYIDVGVATVMLMQSVWIGVVLDYFVHKVKPSKVKIIAIVIILIGTVLATNILESNAKINYSGLLFGFFAAIAYSYTFLVTNNVAKQYKPIARSMYIVWGALIIISIIWSKSALTNFDTSILWTWGPILALFSMILPPLLLTKGMPLIDIGLGSIVGSMELPVTVIVAYLVLSEKANILQWIGIILILFAIFLMNIYSPKSSKA